MANAVERKEQGVVHEGGALLGIEPDGALRSFESLRGELAALEPAELVTARIDVQRAASLVYDVARRDLVPARRAVFERLSLANFYDLRVLDGLPRAAECAWYARLQQQAVLAEASAANVPEVVIQLAYEVRARMQQVLDYWLGDDPRFVARLKFVREGTGHQDLANDLQLLAELYERDEVRGAIESDRKRYRASDVAEAKRLRGVIFTGFRLAREGDAERWTGLYQRAATLLLRSYDEHRVAGQFAFRKDEDVASTYPSLFAAVRSAASKRTPPADPGEGAPPGEVPVVSV